MDKGGSGERNCLANLVMGHKNGCRYHVELENDEADIS